MITQKPYPIQDISLYSFEKNEHVGSKSKFWVKDANGNQYLFKSTHTQDKHGAKIIRTGEDWAEKVANELARFLKIPCADYDLAVNQNERGIITRNFLSDETLMLSLGNELIVNLKRNYKYQPLSRVHAITQRVIKHKPLKFNSMPHIKTASEFFVGYLMLDVLISNQDRHSENWGMIKTAKGTTHLAPTFDHAASLGRSESDKKRKIILINQNKNQGIEQYIAKSKSYFSLRNKRLTLLEAFSYYKERHKKAAQAWGEQLYSLDKNTVFSIIDRIPNNIATEVTKEFTTELILQNKSRILHAIFDQ